MIATPPSGFESFCPTLAELFRTRQVVGRNGKKFDGMGALSSANNLVVLRMLFLALRPERTLEVGMCFGGSALLFTASHHDLHRQSARQHLALDPYQSTVWDDAGLLAVERAGLSGYLDFRPTFSSVELPRLLSERSSFDLVYIDGSHLFEDVFVDFYYVSRLLSEDGVVAFDDSTNPHVRKLLRFVRCNLSSAFAEMDLTPYRGEGGKSLKYRMARFVGKTQLTAFRRIGPPSREWDAEFTDF